MKPFLIGVLSPPALIPRSGYPILHVFGEFMLGMSTIYIGVYSIHRSILALIGRLTCLSRNTGLPPSATGGVGDFPACGKAGWCSERFLRSWPLGSCCFAYSLLLRLEALSRDRLRFSK